MELTNLTVSGQSVATLLLTILYRLPKALAALAESGNLSLASQIPLLGDYGVLIFLVV